MHSLRSKILSVTIGAIIITMIVAAVFGIVAIRNVCIDNSRLLLQLLC